jgi:hypothetical protein
MTGANLWQMLFGLVAVLTPWAVVATARSMVRPPAVADRIRRSEDARRLLLATAVAAAIVGIAGAGLAPLSPAMGFVDLIGFAVTSAIAWPVLAALDRASRAGRETPSPLRISFVRPRRVFEYASLVWRALALVASASGVLAMAVRVFLRDVDGRRLLVPVLFVLIAPVFAILHEVWLRQVVSEGAIAEDDDLEEQIRRDAAMVQRWGTVLVVAFVTLGHVLLDVNWLLQPGLAFSGALAGAVLGVVGCAHLLASDVMTRRYRMAITPADRAAQSGR